MPLPPKFVLLARPTYQSLVLRDAPVGYWRLSETSGTEAQDSSGRGISGTYMGGYTLGSVPILIGNGAPSVTLASASQGRVEIPNDSAYIFSASLPFSIEAWIVPGSGTGLTVFEKGFGNLATNIEYIFAVNGGAGGTGLYYRGAWRYAASLDGLSVGLAYHIVVVSGGTDNTLTFYKNGEMSDVITGITGSYSSDTAYGPYIGVQGVAFYNPYSGRISDVALYNKVLSDASIMRHYSRGRGR